MPEFLTIPEVAARWGVSQPTIRRMVEDGTLACLRARRTVRVSASSVMAFEQACPPKPARA